MTIGKPGDLLRPAVNRNPSAKEEHQMKPVRIERSCRRSRARHPGHRGRRPDLDRHPRRGRLRQHPLRAIGDRRRRRRGDRRRQRHDRRRHHHRAGRNVGDGAARHRHGDGGHPARVLDLRRSPVVSVSFITRIGRQGLASHVDPAFRFKVNNSGGLRRRRRHHPQGGRQRDCGAFLPIRAALGNSTSPSPETRSPQGQPFTVSVKSFDDDRRWHSGRRSDDSLRRPDA